MTFIHIHIHQYVQKPEDYLVLLCVGSVIIITSYYYCIFLNQLINNLYCI